MNEPSEVSLRPYIDVLDEAIAEAHMTGLDGDWHALRRRCDALTLGVEDEEAGTPEGAPAMYHLDHEVSIQVLTRMPTPAVLKELVSVLRAGEGPVGSLGSWAALDGPSFERIQIMERNSEASLVTALARHAEKPRYASLIEATRALEDLLRSRQRRQGGRDPKALELAARKLADGVGEVYPPLARRVISDEMEATFRSRFEGKPVAELEPTKALWHHKIPGVGIWYPVWEEIRSGGGEPEPPGPWFVFPYQSVYEQLRDEIEAERSRRAREEEERARLAGLAEQQRLEDVQLEQAARQARVRGERRAAQGERRRLSALEVEEERRRRELDELERQAYLEALEREQEAERVESKERSTRLRISQPPQPLYWKGSSEEIRLRWVEAEWVKWCKSKGMMPWEFSDEDRERFFRTF